MDTSKYLQKVLKIQYVLNFFLAITSMYDSMIFFLAETVPNISLFQSLLIRWSTFFELHEIPQSMDFEALND